MSIDDGMELGKNLVQLQELPSWRSNSVLSAHFGTTDYLLGVQESKQIGDIQYYQNNEMIWYDILGGKVTAGFEICLEKFLILDWFPRAPGLYYTHEAK